MTVGTEFEMQFIDPESRDLTTASIPFMEKMSPDLRKYVKAEIFQSMIELNSPVGRNPAELREPMRRMLSEMHHIADQMGLQLAMAGTHPFADHVVRKVYPAERFQDLLDRNQWIARRLVIFGQHVHVAVRDDFEFFTLFSGLQWYLPAILAMSASSPFWRGHDTGLQSVRMTLFESIPTGGHPCHVSSMDEFNRMYQGLLNAKAIGSHKDLWWDLRPSPAYGTIEIRMPDMSPRLDDCLQMAALVQTLSRGLLDGMIRFDGVPPDWIVRENKWRAARTGLDAEFVVDRSGATEPLRSLVPAWIRQLEPTAKLLGTTMELGALRERLSEPTSAERQRAAFEPRQSLLDVVDSLTSEFETSLR